MTFIFSQEFQNADSSKLCQEIAPVPSKCSFAAKFGANGYVQNRRQKHIHL